MAMMIATKLLATTSLLTLTVEAQNPFSSVFPTSSPGGGNGFPTLPPPGAAKSGMCSMVPSFMKSMTMGMCAKDTSASTGTIGGAPAIAECAEKPGSCCIAVKCSSTNPFYDKCPDSMGQTKCVGSNPFSPTATGVCQCQTGSCSTDGKTCSGAGSVSFNGTSFGRLYEENGALAQDGGVSFASIFSFVAMFGLMAAVAVMVARLRSRGSTFAEDTQLEMLEAQEAVPEE
eukprot:TRINITY_DN112170_c0_g1_i1.p1 TRINITY_DN112170_c0_g1~~TRINITY_DN112170_c0_g1_i1.p1  ORF type:complete len:230 (+),score=34.77 TRINITY_DN112170_c0_g1_i1:86-775(+)